MILRKELKMTKTISGYLIKTTIETIRSLEKIIIQSFGETLFTCSLLIFSQDFKTSIDGKPEKTARMIKKAYFSAKAGFFNDSKLYLEKAKSLLSSRGHKQKNFYKKTVKTLKQAMKKKNFASPQIKEYLQNIDINKIESLILQIKENLEKIDIHQALVIFTKIEESIFMKNSNLVKNRQQLTCLYHPNKFLILKAYFFPREKKEHFRRVLSCPICDREASIDLDQNNNLTLTREKEGHYFFRIFCERKLKLTLNKIFKFIVDILKWL